MVVKFFTFSKFHNKEQTGSTTIRVMNLLKHWKEASLYKFGEDYDVLIFQKVYAGQDYKMPVKAKPIKILDIADADWLEGALIVETVKAMNAVVTPTKALAEFIEQFADCPVRVIKDRFCVEDFPKPKEHKGEGNSVVWFGYSHNAGGLKAAIRTLEKLNMTLTVISDKDPMPYRWAENSKGFEEMYNFIEYDNDTLYKELQKHDFALFPKGARPEDRFKSENKTVIAQLCGLPVATSKEDMIVYKDPNKRNEVAKKEHQRVMVEYDCRKSVEEYKDLINEIKS